MRRCPRCKEGLVAAERGGLVLDTCTGCGGVWLDRGELERAVTAPPGTWAAGTPMDVTHEVRYLACPVCGALMTRRVYEARSGVVLDHCGAHGVWADRGELDRARAFVAGGGIERRKVADAERRRLDASTRRAGRGPAANDDGYDWFDLVVDLF